MARFVEQTLCIFIVHVMLILLVMKQHSCISNDLLHENSFNLSRFDPPWSPARATWYGDANGAGTDGGACGYGSSVREPPFSSMVSAGGPSLFNSGRGCGECYEIKCNDNEACSGNPVKVVITDSCPGGVCVSDAVHFDLSGSAFGAMAKSGQADQLRNAGSISIQHMRIPCNYPGVTIAFHIDQGSNPYYFSTTIEFEDGDGGNSLVELKLAGSSSWLPMTRLWGAVWMVNYGSIMKAPFSVRLVAAESGRTVVAENVIPDGWRPGQIYRSRVNF